MTPGRRALLCAATAVVLASCSGTRSDVSKAQSDVANAVSPLAGSWSIDGEVPPPRADLPTFVRLDFETGGSLEASYVAAGGALAKIVNTPSKLKSEHDRFALGDGKRLSIVEGSRSLDYTYDVRDGKLFLTAAGASTGTVYRKDDG